MNNYKDNCSIGNFNLPEIRDLIGGDYQEFIWALNDMGAEGYNTTHYSCSFSLIPMNDRNGKAIIIKDCTAVKSDKIINKYDSFSLILDKDDTKDLRGKYIYQLTILNPDNKQKSQQGIMYFSKNIGTIFDE